MATVKKHSKESKLIKCMKFPIRILMKARDFYVKSMSECNDKLGYGAAMGMPTGQFMNTLPRSYSVSSTRSSSTDDDYRELLRAASTRSLNGKIESELLRRQQFQKSPKQAAGSPNNNMPRSYSVGVGTIDEDKPCDFDEDIKVGHDAFPRSRSYAVSKRTSGGFLQVLNCKRKKER